WIRGCGGSIKNCLVISSYLSSRCLAIFSTNISLPITGFRHQGTTNDQGQSNGGQVTTNVTRQRVKTARQQQQ
ncbi:unnamed protein product, partial (mitochondrion) [Musa acuminata var. zebrina]